MKITLFCPDIECGSCIKVLQRSLKGLKGVSDFSIYQNSLDVEFESSKTSPQKIMDIIKEKGYRVDTRPFTRKTFKERLRDMKENKEKYAVEYKMISFSLITFLLLCALEVIAFFVGLNQIPAFIPLYGWWIFYLNLAVVSIAAAIWHLNSYRTQITSMVGMMIGMTFGMQTGMMIGTIIAATNGLFVGGMVGMLSAVAVGWYNGKCCGVMGVMEGLMAGMMGGLMGAMTGVMFFVDNILLLMPVFMSLNLIIMWALSYMLFEEIIENNERISKNPMDFMSLFSSCFLAIVILIIIMLYGPKTGFAGVLG